MSSDDIILKLNGISKCFEMYAKPVHRLFQTLCAGRKTFYREFWALRHIDLEVKRGECLGIIGRNGAGKSTLLQIITGTLAPTTGSVETRGRVAALLELGSGFNPEFTGRENIYLNATILGLDARSSANYMERIIEFADIGSFIDQPLKTYSTGMAVRLAFAVYTQLAPDILIVDEALAVGDAAFQAKCADQMRRLLESGCTILLVTHDVGTVRSFCTRALWLQHGEIAGCGEVNDITCKFLEDMFGPQSQSEVALACPKNVEPLSSDWRLPGEQPGLRRWGTGVVQVEAFRFRNQHGKSDYVEYGDELTLELRLRVMRDCQVEELAGAFSIRNPQALDILCCTSNDVGIKLPRELRVGECFEMEFHWRNDLRGGDYCLVLAAENQRQHEEKYLDYVENACTFKVLEQFPLFALTRPACQITLRSHTAGMEHKVDR